MKTSLTLLLGQPDASITSETPLDFVARITSDPLSLPKTRDPLTVALVLDRSGSMRGTGLDHAKAAAKALLDILKPTDYLGVVAFDTKAEVIVPVDLVEDRAGIAKAIDSIQAGSSTALHDGWALGVSVLKDAQAKFAAKGLHRVFLLTDGQANSGEVDPDRLATIVKGATKDNITTSVVGMGRDFNEDLMEALSLAGDGNYYYVNSSDKLRETFEAETYGLSRTSGTQVVIQFIPNPELPVRMTNYQSLPPLSKAADELERYALANLMAGTPTELVGCLHIPALVAVSPDTSIKVGTIQVTYRTPEGETVTLSEDAYIKANTDEWIALAKPNPDVSEKVVGCKAALAKQKAAEAVQVGDRDGAMAILGDMRNMIAAGPVTEYTSYHAKLADEALLSAKSDDFLGSAKLLKHQAYRTRLSKDTSAEARGEKPKV